MKDSVHLSKANKERLSKYHSDANVAIETMLNKAEHDQHEITIDYEKLAQILKSKSEPNLNGITIDYEKIKEACADAIAEARS